MLFSYTGLGWFKRTYVKAASFELTMNIENDDETLTVSGKSKYIGI